MEAMRLSLGIGASSNAYIIGKSQRIIFLRLLPQNGVSFSNLAYLKQDFGKSCSASEMVVQKASRKIRGLECKNSGREIESSVENEGGLRTTIQRKKLAVFVSGGGSNFRSIHEAIFKGLIPGEITVLVTDKPSCGGAEYARDNGIQVLLFPKPKSSSEGLSSFDLVTTLRDFMVDFILLAGYLKLIPVELVRAYPRSILNIHPSLLPSFGGKGFYGLKVHKAVIASGARSDYF